MVFTRNLASSKKLKLQLCMKNLRLHSSGVFSNVYRGTLLNPGPRKEIALKKTWPGISLNDVFLFTLSFRSRMFEIRRCKKKKPLNFGIFKN